MKRDKAWWARLTKEERSELYYLERGGNGSGYGGGGYLPEDCSECNCCGTPMLSCGLCPDCSRRFHKLIAKAAGV